jgi:hypothetical protein
MLRYSSCGVREEDLVVLLYFLLASAYGKGHEVEAYSPEIVARRLLVVDGRDREIIVLPVESSERFVISSVKTVFLFCSRVGGLLSQSITHPSKPNLATLLASSSAVVHVGPAQGFLSLLVPLQ